FVFSARPIATNPASNVGGIIPKSRLCAGESADKTLGPPVAADGSVPVRAIATQFMFVPACIAVPANRLVTLRFSSPDVIHGLLITGNNVSTMVVPGFVAQVHTEFARGGDLLMPCHEYCGLGHSEICAARAVQ